MSSSSCDAEFLRWIRFSVFALRGLCCCDNDVNPPCTPTMRWRSWEVSGQFPYHSKTGSSLPTPVKHGVRPGCDVTMKSTGVLPHCLRFQLCTSSLTTALHFVLCSILWCFANKYCVSSLHPSLLACLFVCLFVSVKITAVLPWNLLSFLVRESHRHVIGGVPENQLALGSSTAWIWNPGEFLLP